MFQVDKLPASLTKIFNFKECHEFLYLLHGKHRFNIREKQNGD